jgi:hypothetical protein
MRYLQDQCKLDVDRYYMVPSIEHDRLLDGRPLVEKKPSIPVCKAH